MACFGFGRAGAAFGAGRLAASTFGFLFDVGAWDAGGEAAARFLGMNGGIVDSASTRRHRSRGHDHCTNDFEIRCAVICRGLYEGMTH